MDHSERGTKRICPTTGRKFYDLNRDPIISPYTGEVVPIVAMASHARRPAPAFSRKGPETEEDEPETEGAELVSLDEADAEEADTGGKDIESDDDLGVEDDANTDDVDDDATLIEDDDDNADGLVDVEDDDED
ncbi:TIGR02300 family protein [Methylobacterium radiodurans]|uniref:TIGR02300 family protein n=1 Tax=Methylobacterium radiodurans TaxID=2202828 RepID=A0A2U8VVC4_9HYPH|nr:TIGR02300 family protein [Methylobacterium radiodurans]AWN37192.1 TIGR02300 family protein [Methylobacterium radiodurans]